METELSALAGQSHQASPWSLSSGQVALVSCKANYRVVEFFSESMAWPGKNNLEGL